MDRAKFLEVLEQVAQGRLLQDICAQPGMPSVREVLVEVTGDQDLKALWEQALKLSAQVFTEQALAKAEEIAQAPGVPQKVAAYRVLIEQLKWTAQKRDPSVFGDRQQVQLLVPIQINTTLDLGQGAGAGTPQPAPDDVYRIDLTALKPERALPGAARRTDIEMPEKGQVKLDTPVKVAKRKLAPRVKNEAEMEQIRRVRREKKETKRGAKPL